MILGWGNPRQLFSVRTWIIPEPLEYQAPYNSLIKAQSWQGRSRGRIGAGKR